MLASYYINKKMFWFSMNANQKKKSKKIVKSIYLISKWREKFFFVAESLYLYRVCIRCYTERIEFSLKRFQTEQKALFLQASILLILHCQICIDRFDKKHCDFYISTFTLQRELRLLIITSSYFCGLLKLNEEYKLNNSIC